MKEKFIKQLNDRKHEREMSVRQINGRRYFEKKMGFVGDAPNNYQELKNEVMRWNRVGMQNDQGGATYKDSMFFNESHKFKSTGFARYFDHSHTYPGIDQDLDRLINEGYLIEVTHKDVLRVQNKRTGVDPVSVLYPVNRDKDKDIEVIGSLGKYND